jgi:hypothetical protein
MVIFSLTWVRVELKQATSLFFKPFGPLTGYKATLVHITNLIAVGQFVLALQSAQDLISLALDGLHYFQTYDWLFLMSTITVGYLGWMLYILLHVLQSYTTFPFFHRKRGQRRSYNSQPGKAVVSNKCYGCLLTVDFSLKEGKCCRLFVWPLLQCHKGISLCVLLFAFSNSLENYLF